MSEKNEIVIYTTPEGKETFEVNQKKRYCLAFSKTDGSII